MMDPNVRGSTLILDLMKMYPDGRAIILMNRLGWPCAHCGARVNEPLSLAAKRHGNPVRVIVQCFRALNEGGPSEDEINAAQPRPKRSKDPLAAWHSSATAAAQLTSV
jgi:hypothetical protein